MRSTFSFIPFVVVAASLPLASHAVNFRTPSWLAKLRGVDQGELKNPVSNSVLDAIPPLKPYLLDRKEPVDTAFSKMALYHFPQRVKIDETLRMQAAIYQRVEDLTEDVMQSRKRLDDMNCFPFGATACKSQMDRARDRYQSHEKMLAQSKLELRKVDEKLTRDEGAIVTYAGGKDFKRWYAHAVEVGSPIKMYQTLLPHMNVFGTAAIIEVLLSYRATKEIGEKLQLGQFTHWLSDKRISSEDQLTRHLNSGWSGFSISDVDIKRQVPSPSTNTISSLRGTTGVDIPGWMLKNILKKYNKYCNQAKTKK
uniref:Uncharacterized protein n=1 Tax=Peronospora matthiolae TaxID=2874970 RepID=A0AAV1T0T7_9STRA